jgi:hypothetical protein
VGHTPQGTLQGVLIEAGPAGKGGEEGLADAAVKPCKRGQAVGGVARTGRGVSTSRGQKSEGRVGPTCAVTHKLLDTVTARLSDLLQQLHLRGAQAAQRPVWHGWSQEGGGLQGQGR